MIINGVKLITLLEYSTNKLGLPAVLKVRYKAI